VTSVRLGACFATALAVATASSAGCAHARPADASRQRASTPRGTIALATTADFRTVFLIFAASGRVTRVRAPVGLLDLKADLSRDGRRIAVGGLNAIWTFARSGGAARRVVGVARNGAAPGEPSWSPSGRQLVFTRDGDVFTVDASGKNLKRLFDGRAYAPDWSPTGTEILFVRNPASRSGAGVIHSIGTDGRNLRSIVFGGHPDVSPDGAAVAFARRDGIYVAALAGGRPRRIIRNAENPEWSPDGRFLAFTRDVRCYEAGCSGRVFIVRATGGRAHAVGPRVFDIGPLSWSR
jgi:Tol biopolymer transport system component